MTPFVQDSDFTLWHGDALEVLREIPSGSVDCCVTSPPYWGLRDYGTPGQLGLESTPGEYVTRMVEVFREVRRVLADHGTCWINLGDSYAHKNTTRIADEWDRTYQRDKDKPYVDSSGRVSTGSAWSPESAKRRDRAATGVPDGLKEKDLVGIPWRVAFALQADGWYLRSDIIWSKPNPMPESVTDRPTKAHEYVFLLSKSPRYWFDQEAVREPAAWERWGDQTNPKHEGTNGAAGWIGARSKDALTARSNKPGWSGNPNVHGEKGHPLPGAWTDAGGGRNIRSVWEIATQPYAAAHFAVFPEELARRCILAGCPERVCGTCGKARERLLERTPMLVRPTPKREAWQAEDDHARTQVGGTMLQPPATETVGWSDCGHNAYRPGTVLDPFGGSGTTALVARKHQRKAVLIELNEDYCRLAAKRLQQLSLLTEASV